jgi:hypothetical protein
MIYLGDFIANTNVWFPWSTNDTNGASITRAVDGTIKVLRDDGIIITAGITDIEDSPLTGIHKCTLDLSAHQNYAIGHDYCVYIEAATIDGQIVNAPLRQFSIQNRTSLLKATGVTVGGTWPLDKAIKVMLAWQMGLARDKSGVSGVQELLDPDDSTTVIAEVAMSTTTPYKQVTIKI